MNRFTTKKIVMNGLMIALVFCVTYFTKIPGPVGPFNIGDTAIIAAAVLLGRGSGAIAGGIGSALADLAMGYSIFAPITLVVKGVEGYAVGRIAHKSAGTKGRAGLRIAAVAIGAFIMIAGYFFAESFVLSLYSPEFGIAKAIQDTIFNIVQGIVSAIAGYILTTLLDRTKIQQYIE